MKEQRWYQVIISVGSNIAPRENITKSLDILSSETKLLDSADVIETAPVGYVHQDNFLNTACLIETALKLEEFNKLLKSIENRLGRKRGPIKSGPRTIDLDIIIWDGVVLSDEYYQYDYVSIPVNQILAANNLVIRPSGESRV
jgi:2-amino-4-hydroxy-6-hydroxymethyldihydropteridine diphosphokinase